MKRNRHRRTKSDTGETASSNHFAPRVRDRNVVADYYKFDILVAGGMGHQPRKAEMEVIPGIYPGRCQH